MRLADFIRAEIESIVEEWDAFARTILSAAELDADGLRDHAREMLMAVADDLDTPQSAAERIAKSKGLGPKNDLKTWAEVHGGGRQSSGFSVNETVSEFRALRASVVSLWSKTARAGDDQLEDLTRFHEAIDQAVAESLEQYTIVKEMQTRLFGTILLASADPIYVLDREGRFIYVNTATADLLSLPPDAIIGKSNRDLGLQFGSDFEVHLQEVVTTHSTFRGEFVQNPGSGPVRTFEYLLAPVMDEHTNIEAVVGISRDITERALAEQKIWHSAHHDFLTGLPNRRLFLDRLEQEVRHAKRSGQPFAVLFMDLDGFKEVNDSLGHEAGDHVLRSVAGRISTCVREADTVARLGGDEFTVIITEAQQRADVVLVAQKIIEALAEPVTMGEDRIGISCSIGVTFFPEHASSTSDLLRTADQAMYSAKKAGSNRICFYEADVV